MSCAEGVQSHTVTLFKLLRKKRIPTLIFLNKTDREGADAARVTACMSGIPGRSGPDADRLPRAVEHIEDAQKRLAQQLDSCMAARMEVMRGILTVGDSAGRQVLQRRYLMGQSFAEIADAMGVVQRRVYQLHRAAVERMEPEKEA